MFFPAAGAVKNPQYQDTLTQPVQFQPSVAEVDLGKSDTVSGLDASDVRLQDLTANVPPQVV
jgi:hypothetical protein